MRRFTFLRPVVVVVLLGVLAPYTQLVAVAQEATPEAEEMMSEGVTEQLVMLATGVDLASPFDVSTIRLTFEPGGTNRITDSPEVGVLVVESGSLTVEVDGPVMVTRGAGMGEAMATAEATGDFSAMMESIAAGEAVTLAAGDAAYIPGNILCEIRNESQAPATGLAFIVYPSEGMMGEATPMP
jgi:hypothetical protein